MARPKKEIDEDKIFEMAKIGCTYKEIGAVLGVSHDTIERRYASLVKRGWEQMKQSLRRFQYQAAADGNVTAMIWLGKQYLDQTDKRAVEMSGELDIGRTWIEALRELSNGSTGDTARADESDHSEMETESGRVH